MTSQLLSKRKNSNPYDLDASDSVPSCAKKCLSAYDSNLFLNSKCQNDDCPCSLQEPHTSNSSSTSTALSCLSSECYPTTITATQENNLENMYDSICSIINDGSNKSKDAKRGLSGGAIAGIVVGCVAFALLLALAGFFCLRRRRRTHQSIQDEAAQIGRDNRRVSFDKNPHTVMLQHERSPSPPSERIISVIPHRNSVDSIPLPKSPVPSNNRYTANSTIASTQDSSLQPEVGSYAEPSSPVHDSFPEPPPETRHRLYAPMIKEYNRSRHSSGTTQEN